MSSTGWYAVRDRPGEVVPRRRRSRGTVLVAVVGTLLLGGVAATWALGRAAVPHVVEGGWHSDDLPIVDVSTPFDSHTIVVCEPGELRGSIGVSAAAGAPVDVELVEVRLDLLDDPDLDLAHRVATRVMSDPGGDLEDTEAFTGWSLARGSSDEARLRVTWQLEDCPTMDGTTTLPTVEVTYRALGHTHRRHVPLVDPLVLTTQDPADVAAQVTATRREP